MKIELDLILKQTNSKFFMKMIEIKKIKISKELVSRLNQSFYQNNNNKIKIKNWKTQQHTYKNLFSPMSLDLCM
jgi:hypothetical protein